MVGGPGGDEDEVRATGLKATRPSLLNATASWVPGVSRSGDTREAEDDKGWLPPSMRRFLDEDGLWSMESAAAAIGVESRCGAVWPRLCAAARWHIRSRSASVWMQNQDDKNERRQMMRRRCWMSGFRRRAREHGQPWLWSSPALPRARFLRARRIGAPYCWTRALRRRVATGPRLLPFPLASFARRPLHSIGKSWPGIGRRASKGIDILSRT